jgi:hypothetical protein
MDLVATAFPSRKRDALNKLLVFYGIHRPLPGPRPWVVSDVATLRSMWYAGDPHKAIAKALARSPEAINAAANAHALPRRIVRWTSGQRSVLYREVDAMVERLSHGIRRTPGALGTPVLRLLGGADPATLVKSRGRSSQGRCWTVTEYAAVLGQCSAVVTALAERLEMPKPVIVDAVTRAVFTYGPRRRRAGRIVDLGGTADSAIARKKAA